MLRVGSFLTHLPSHLGFSGCNVPAYYRHIHWSIFFRSTLLNQFLFHIDNYNQRRSKLFPYLRFSRWGTQKYSSNPSIQSANHAGTKAQSRDGYEITEVTLTRSVLWSVKIFAYRRATLLPTAHQHPAMPALLRQLQRHRPDVASAHVRRSSARTLRTSLLAAVANRSGYHTISSQRVPTSVLQGPWQFYKRRDWALRSLCGLHRGHHRRTCSSRS